MFKQALPHIDNLDVDSQQYRTKVHAHRIEISPRDPSEPAWGCAFTCGESVASLAVVRTRQMVPQHIGDLVSSNKRIACAPYGNQTVPAWKYAFTCGGLVALLAVRLNRATFLHNQ